MCVADNSVDLFTTTCPMCKVFRHPSRCIHKRETCRNRVNHPKHDVVYITNAEIATFKGCGYCKWATMNPPPHPSKSGMHNPGWPGCCRPPQPSELDKILPADWPAVNIVHRTPIPPEARQILDAVKIPYGSSATSPPNSGGLNAFAVAHSGVKDALRPAGTERKGLARANSSPNGTVRSPPQKSRAPISGTGSGSSPQMKHARLGSSPAGHVVSPTDSLQTNSPRRTGSDTQRPLKRVEGFRTTPPASVRRLTTEGEVTPVTRTNLASLNLGSLNSPEREYPSLKRRSSAVGTHTAPLVVAINRGTATPKALTKSLERDAPKVSSERNKSENTNLAKGLKALNLSSSSSDSSSDSSSRSSSNDTNTVTSDGGFTDYLSDESEAELQRQAEVRAALLEQSRQEEQEFRAARRQLANVDLRPPQAWTTGRKAINTGCARASSLRPSGAMHLARHAISTTAPVEILDAHFDASASMFVVATSSGFAVYRTWPLQLLRVREFAGGSLAIVMPMHTSSLLFLVGGGASPLYPPNKVVVWDDVRGRAVAELEFRERVRGLAVRRGWLVVALRRRAVAFRIGEEIRRHKEWDTCDNQHGLVAIATDPYSTLLAIAGRQTGHVQLVHLPECPPPAPVPGTPSPRRPASKSTKNPASIIAAHTSALTTLTVLPSGRLIATTSSHGTLVRVWDAHNGQLVRELRRGSDKAVFYGVAFRPDEKEVCCWSDKGTVHVFSLATGSASSNRQSSLSPLAPFLPLPRYFDSKWSYAQYRIPTQKTHMALSSGGRMSDVVQDERYTVAWVQVPLPESTSSSFGDKKNTDKGKLPESPPEYQMIALTYSGGWYRIALPSSPTASPGAASRGISLTRAASTSGASGSFRPSHRARSSSGSSIGTGRSGTPRTAKGKGKEKESDEKSDKAGSECTLQEFRRFGRWDGWG